MLCPRSTLTFNFSLGSSSFFDLVSSDFDTFGTGLTVYNYFDSFVAREFYLLTAIELGERDTTSEELVISIFEPSSNIANTVIGTTLPSLTSTELNWVVTTIEFD